MVAFTGAEIMITFWQQENGKLVKCEDDAIDPKKKLWVEGRQTDLRPWRKMPRAAGRSWEAVSLEAPDSS